MNKSCTVWNLVEAQHTEGGNLSDALIWSLQPRQTVCTSALTLVLHSLTVQSKEEVTNRWEKSRGPAAVWQLIPVMGPWWPSNISLMPALLWRTQEEVKRKRTSYDTFLYVA